MENINLPSSPKTPAIIFDASTGILELSGRSIMEMPLSFFQPIIDWMDEYAKQPQATTILQFNLNYFNTASTKCLLELLRRAKQLNQSGNKVTIKWYYEVEDEDMLESGEDFSSLLAFPFEFIEKA